MSDQEDYGEVLLADGKREKISGIFTVYRDEREVTIAETVGGTLVVRTKSWLRQNDRKEVETINCYTKETFAMMLEAMCLSAEYLGFDVKEESKKLHGDGQICYEYAGRGVPNFAKESNNA